MRAGERNGLLGGVEAGTKNRRRMRRGEPVEMTGVGPKTSAGAGRRPLAVVVLAAGLGTRMRSTIAKVLHPLGGRPLIAYVLDAVRRLAPERLVVVVGHQAESVRAACENGEANGELSIVKQRERLGTGHAVRCAMSVLTDFTGDVLIVYGDVPALRTNTLYGLVHGHGRSGAVLSLLTAYFPVPTGYGRIVRSESGEIDRIVEEGDATPQQRQIREINPGIYCVDAEFLRQAVEGLVADNAQGEYYLTDIVSLARKKGRPLWSHGVDDPTEVLGINTQAELAEMEARTRQMLVEQWMAAGVTCEDPATVYIGPEVQIGRDTTLGPNTQLRGKTVLGTGCHVDGSAYLQDARIGDRVRLLFGVVVTDSDVGDDVQIGPFAHLRPGTTLAVGVRVGNFVETKKATLGPGTKASHLSYLGDVTVGKKTNIGAGTITCNYDGFAKHPTVIGDRVQIGSDTQLVAPVTVESDAYVGAGTTVTSTVPAGALVITRVPQRVVPGWVARRRARQEEGGAAPASAAGPRKTPAAGTRARPAKAAKSRKSRKRGKRTPTAGPLRGRRVAAARKVTPARPRRRDDAKKKAAGVAPARKRTRRTNTEARAGQRRTRRRRTIR